MTIHREVTRRLPTADFVYLADQGHMPYGTRTGAEIVSLTKAGCERLFREDCDLIVLACNTASAVALQRLQRGWLPEVRQGLGRAVNVLGIVVPTIEVVTGRPWSHRSVDRNPGTSEVLGIFATQATARSKVFEVEVAKRAPYIRVVTEPCPGLAGLIEAGAGAETLSPLIDQHVQGMCRRIGGAPGKVILGSTHYQVVADLFRRALPATSVLIEQPRATGDALQHYLERHREFRTGTGGARRFLTTGNPGAQHPLIGAYWGERLQFDPA